MLIDQIKTPFRWYSDASLSSRVRRECEKYRYRLITPKDRLLPFMFRFPTPDVPSYPLHWRIYNSDTGALHLLIDDSTTADYIDYYRFNGWDYLVYKGTTPLPAVNLPSGFYYAEIEMADGTIFTSEEFWVDCDEEGNTLSGDFSDDFNDDFSTQFSDSGILQGLKKYTKLTWWHPCDIGILLYQTGYINMLYVEAEMLKGESELLEEGKEDGNKDFVPTFQKLTDNISFTDYVPEHIVNALQGIPIHSNAFVTTRDNQYVGRVKRFALTFDTYLCHTRIEAKFQQETTLLRAQCCGNNDITNVYMCAARISGLNFVVQDTAGQNVKHVKVTWNVDSGAGPYRVSCNLFAAPGYQDVNATEYDFGSNIDVGTVFIVEVKPVCVGANGREMFGNVLKLSFTVKGDGGQVVQ